MLSSPSHWTVGKRVPSYRWSSAVTVRCATENSCDRSMSLPSWREVTEKLKEKLKLNGRVLKISGFIGKGRYLISLSVLFFVPT